MSCKGLFYGPAFLPVWDIFYGCSREDPLPRGNWLEQTISSIWEALRGASQDRPLLCSRSTDSSGTCKNTQLTKRWCSVTWRQTAIRLRSRAYSSERRCASQYGRFSFSWERSSGRFTGSPENHSQAG